jgi:hypothetical protein
MKKLKFLPKLAIASVASLVCLGAGVAQAADFNYSMTADSIYDFYGSFSYNSDTDSSGLIEASELTDWQLSIFNKGDTTTPLTTYTFADLSSLDWNLFTYDYNLGNFSAHEMGYDIDKTANLDFLLTVYSGVSTWYFVDGNYTGVSTSANLITVQPANSTSVPEPSSLLSLVTLGAMITTFKSKKKQEV